LDNPQTLKHYCKLSDDRGGFEGIVNQGSWQEINIVHTHAGCMRGGHYHCQTTEVIFLLTGKADVELSPCNDLTTTTRITLDAGEGIQIPPMTVHRLLYLEQSSHVQLLDQRFDPSHQDLFNVSSVNE
jgi:dTDP-4-dehydrorhamnose 3,5-epimerase-like enzyme